MSVLIIIVAFAAAVVFELWAWNNRHGEVEAEAKRGDRACLAELAEIEMHRPDHVIGSRDA